MAVVSERVAGVSGEGAAEAEAVEAPHSALGEEVFEEREGAEFGVGGGVGVEGGVEGGEGGVGGGVVPGEDGGEGGDCVVPG